MTTLLDALSVNTMINLPFIRQFAIRVIRWSRVRVDVIAARSGLDEDELDSFLGGMSDLASHEAIVMLGAMGFTVSPQGQIGLAPNQSAPAAFRVWQIPTTDELFLLSHRECLSPDFRLPKAVFRGPKGFYLVVFDADFESSEFTAALVFASSLIELSWPGKLTGRLGFDVEVCERLVMLDAAAWMDTINMLSLSPKATVTGALLDIANGVRADSHLDDPDFPLED